MINLVMFFPVILIALQSLCISYLKATWFFTIPQILGKNFFKFLPVKLSIEFFLNEQSFH